VVIERLCGAQEDVQYSGWTCGAQEVTYGAQRPCGAHEDMWRSRDHMT
jgi:hypothetical protein